jgi:hypothetical protein
MFSLVMLNCTVKVLLNNIYTATTASTYSIKPHVRQLHTHLTMYHDGFKVTDDWPDVHTSDQLHMSTVSWFVGIHVLCS